MRENGAPRNTHATKNGRAAYGFSAGASMSCERVRMIPE